MQDIKQQIIQNFSRHAHHYDQYAHVQKYAAQRLCGYIRELNILPKSKILEIGCGTGFISEKLIEMFPECTFIITDISPGMLKKCRDNLIEKGIDLETVYFQLLDGETLESLDRYDLVVSGLTVQWFENFQGWLEVAGRSLKPGSTFVFSYLSDRSFPEWKDSCRQLEIPYSGNKLPDHDLLRKLSKNKDIRCLWESEFKTEQYDSLLHFFSELKKIGASSKPAEYAYMPSPSTLRKLDHFHSNGRGCEITHHIVYGIITA